MRATTAGDESSSGSSTGAAPGRGRRCRAAPRLGLRFSLPLNEGDQLFRMNGVSPNRNGMAASLRSHVFIDECDAGGYDVSRTYVSVINLDEVLVIVVNRALVARFVMEVPDLDS